MNNINEFFIRNKLRTAKRGQTKIQQLVHVISESIAHGVLKEGESLPSVNRLSTVCNFSRDTVFKAYKLLKERNLIESAPMRGYFVTGGAHRVFMLLDDFSAFKEQLYNSFRNSLSDNYSVDLLFHHYNPKVFRQLVEYSLGRYSAYIVMNINNKGVDPVLSKIEPDKLLVLDMGNPVSENMNFVIQDFDMALEQCLEKGLHLIRKYSEIRLVYDEKSTPHPSDTVLAVKRFCTRHNIAFSTVANIDSAEIRSGVCWFIIRDSDLVEVIKICREKHLEPGKDIGILSYNDTPMKQIVGGGVSVISINFNRMGEMAAEFVKSKKKTSFVLPPSLILRETL